MMRALEGQYGDHTGYYNEQDWFPVFTIDRITQKRAPIYHSTYTGKPPDARHPAGRQHADRLPRLRLPRERAGQQDGH